MRHLRTMFLLLMLGFALGIPVAVAQSPPATLPPNTVYGRLGAGQSGPGQALPFPTLGAALAPYTFTSSGFGVDQNVLNSQTSNYTVATTDCGKTIQAGTGSTGLFTITLPSVSGFAVNCSVLVTNGDTARGKRLSGFPSNLNTILWPNQSVGVKIVNGAWQSFYVPPRWVVSSNLTIYIDPANGSDTNDCLAATTGACAIAHRAMAILGNEIVNNAVITMQWANGTGSAYTADLPITAVRYQGIGTVNLQGNISTPDDVVLNFTSTMNCVICFSYVGGQWGVHGFNISTSNGSSSNDIFQEGYAGVVTYGNIDFGANGAGSLVTGEIGAHFETDAPITISGNAADYISCADFSVCHAENGGDTFVGTPAFSNAFLVAHGSGAVVAYNATFTGSISGTSCNASDGALVDNNPISALPGSGTCAIGPGTLVGVLQGNPGFGGPTTGANGAITLYGLTDGAVSLIAPPTGGPISGAPDINAALTFSTLPTAATAAGNISYITDGKASNCADSACTTFGTAVTGGGGALPLLVWYTGAAWHLVGK